MPDSLLDYWQKEADRFDSSSHANGTRAIATGAAAVTGVASVVIGSFYTHTPELMLIIPVFVLGVVALAFSTLQSVLYKGLYQYQAELEIARILKTEHKSNYATWEERGGRAATASTMAFAVWVIGVFLALVTVIAAALYGTSEIQSRALWKRVVADGYEPTIIALSVFIAALFLWLFAATVMMLVRYRKDRNELSQEGFWRPVAPKTKRLSRISKPKSVTHPKAAINGDDGAGDVGGVV